MKLERILMITTATLWMGGVIAWIVVAELMPPAASLWMWGAAVLVWSLPLLGSLIYFAFRLGRKDDS